MKIVFTSTGTDWESMMDPRFGRTEYLFIYDDEEDKVSTYDNHANANEAHGAGTQTAQKLFELHPDVLITGNGPGGNAASVIEKMGIKVFTGASKLSVHEALNSFRNGLLKEQVL